MPQADLVMLERQLLAIGSSEDARSCMYKQGMLLMPKGSVDFKETNRPRCHG